MVHCYTGMLFIIVWWLFPHIQREDSSVYTSIDNFCGLFASLKLCRSGDSHGLSCLHSENHEIPSPKLCFEVKKVCKFPLFFSSFMKKFYFDKIPLSQISLHYSIWGLQVWISGWARYKQLFSHSFSFVIMYCKIYDNSVLQPSLTINWRSTVGLHIGCDLNDEGGYDPLLYLTAFSTPDCTSI